MDVTKRSFNNPTTGHQVTFLQTAEETGGELLQLEYGVTRPAGQMDLYWETVFGLAAAGKLNEKGVPGIWQVAVLVPTVDTYAPGLPVGLQKLLFGSILGWIGRRLGYRARYEKPVPSIG